MADNSLDPGRPPFGWFADGLPGNVTPDTTTMLEDDGGRVTLPATAGSCPWRTTAGLLHFQRDEDRESQSRPLVRSLEHPKRDVKHDLVTEYPDLMQLVWS